MSNNKTPNAQKFNHSDYMTRDKIVKIHLMRLFLYVNEDALTDILTEQRVRISCPWKTNDATEAVAAHETVRSTKVNEVGYICLSAVCDSPAMWGHYANRAKGACLVFDFNVFPAQERQFEILKNGMSRSIPTWIQEIKYEDNRAVSHVINQWNNEKEPNFDLLTTKSKDWEREREYRIFYYLEHINPDNIEIPKEKNLSDVNYYDREILTNLSGIILGVNSNISPHAITTVLSNIKKRNKQNGAKYPIFIPVDDITIVKANYHETKFDYEVNLEDIEHRHEILINKYKSNLQSAHWHRFFINVMLEFLIRDKEFFCIDNDSAYSTRIDAFEKDEQFIIVQILDSDGKHHGKYALFEHNSNRLDNYRYVRNVNQDFLAQLYQNANKQQNSFKHEQDNQQE